MNLLNFKFITGLFVVFTVAFVGLILSMDRVINIYDEGVILTGAMRVNAGDIPHRDFYVMYGPAVFYLLSWFFDVFGQSVLVERVFDLVIRAGIITAVYASLTLYCRKSIVVFVTVICALWLIFVGQHGYPVYPALLLIIGSSMFLLQTLVRNNSIVYLFMAGLLTGLAALFRYDVGFFAFVAHILAIILILSQSKYGRNNKVRYIFYELFPYVLAAGFPVAAVLIWYGFNGVLSSFIHDVISFPGENYYRTRHLPFPGVLYTILHPKHWAIYIPIAVICVVAIGFIKKNSQLFKTQSDPSGDDAISGNTRTEFLIIFLLLTVVFYLKAITRIGIEQMQLALIPSMMILALIMEISVNYKRWFRILAVTLAIISCASVLTTSYQRVIKGKPNFIKILNTGHSNNFVLSDVSEFYKLVISPDVSHIDVESVGLPVARRKAAFFVDQDRDAAIRFIKQNTAPDERIFIGLTRHDKVFWNDVSSYFQSGRLPATKWHHFDPGLQTGAEIQSEIIADLEQNKISYIWLESTWENYSEPNESAISSGVTILDEYIRAKYQSVQNFGKISVWQRKNL